MDNYLIIKKEPIKFKSIDFELRSIKITHLTQWYPPYILFNYFKENIYYKIWLKFILRLPYWLIMTIPGGLVTQLCFTWAFIGREPFTVIFSFIYITELFAFISFLKFFLHFEGVYKYCLEEFGEDFMEHYIGNPLGIIRKQAGKLVFYGGMTGIGFSADQYDRSTCCQNRIMEMKEYGNFCKENSLKIDMDMIHKEIPSRHIPRVDQFSNAITDYISDLGNSKEINLKF
jgi:hypothetical protein